MANLDKIAPSNSAKTNGAKKQEKPQGPSLAQLKKIYTQFIEEAQIEGDYSREYEVAQKYVNILKDRYQKAAIKHDRKSMNEIASALWYGIPGSFKGIFVVQKNNGTIEVNWGLLPRDQALPDQCQLKTQEYLFEVNKLRTLADKIIKYHKEIKALKAPYLARSFSIYPQTDCDKSVKQAWKAANTEENRALLRELRDNLNQLSSERAMEFLGKLAEASRAGKKEEIALVITALRIKMEITGEDFYARNNINGIKAEIKQTLENIKRIQWSAGQACAVPFEQELYGYSDQSVFSVKVNKEGMVTIEFYNNEHPEDGTTEMIEL